MWSVQEEQNCLGLGPKPDSQLQGPRANQFKSRMRGKIACEKSWKMTPVFTKLRKSLSRKLGAAAGTTSRPWIIVSHHQSSTRSGFQRGVLKNSSSRPIHVPRITDSRLEIVFKVHHRVCGFHHFHSASTPYGGTSVPLFFHVQWIWLATNIKPLLG